MCDFKKIIIFATKYFTNPELLYETSSHFIVAGPVVYEFKHVAIDAQGVAFLYRDHKWRDYSR